MKLVVAEKPSVARDLARVLGARSKQEGALVGGGFTVTWCIGHLVELEEPEAYDPAWKRWSLDTLPMVPELFRLRPARKTLAQWRIVRDLLRRRDFQSVINACDAGREGELIFRSVYARAGCRLPVERLWISSLTPDAIRAGFQRLQAGRAYAGLAAAARCRSEADWLVGLNATRAMTLVSPGRGVHSIGRVQTPTLALVVDREQEIRRFVPRDYWELLAKVATEQTFTAKWTAPSGATRLEQESLAEALAARVKAAAPDGRLTVAEAQKKDTRERAPLLFDLTTLQRTANQRYGFSADRTLNAAQALYERHKLITYPRTSSRYLSEDLRGRLPGLVAAFAGHPEYGPHAARLTERPLPLSKRILDDSKVGDHHAIIPTGTGRDTRLGQDEGRIYDLVVRRFLAALHPDARFQSTELVLVAGEAGGRPKRGKRADEALLDVLPAPPDRFIARGRVVVDPGWQAVEPPRRNQETLLPEVRTGERLPAELSVISGQTKPPPRHTEASLLGAMETAGKRVEDDALREAMKECGLGTPATRASIIETLLRREYLVRDKKSLLPTDKGIALIERLPVPTLRSPELTGTWEARLQRMVQSEDSAEAFMQDVRSLVEEVVRTIGGSRPPVTAPEEVGRCPRCGQGVFEGRSSFDCAACPLRIPCYLAGRRLEPGEVRTLLAQGRTKVLSGFKSKKKRRFRAALVLDEGEVRFSFSERREQKPDETLARLTCPRCEHIGLVPGRRAWGCARWRDGCAFTIPYVFEGKKLTRRQLEDLLTKGRTRKAKFGATKGRIHLEEGILTLRVD